jgi:preprotein translocase subunit SecG
MNVVLILVIVVCVLLTFIVLIQNPKGGGIAANFSSGNQIMGVKRTNDFVEKATWTLALVMCLLILSSNIFTGGSANSQQSVIQNEIDEGSLNDQQYRSPASLPDAPTGEPAGDVIDEAIPAAPDQSIPN